jgi:threonine/homoserine/homoserine lactone efflux protein
MNHTLHDLISMIVGLNLLLVGSAAVLAAAVAVARKKKEITSTFAVLSFFGGPLLIYLGITMAMPFFR